MPMFDIHRRTPVSNGMAHRAPDRAVAAYPESCHVSHMRRAGRAVLAALAALTLSIAMMVALAPAAHAEMPSSYDPRTTGAVSDARDQAPWGMCWDFAGMAALESSLIAHGLADSSIDLSEEAVVWSIMANAARADGSYPTCGWSQTMRDDSGYSIMMTGYLSTWQGPKLESDVPYYIPQDPDDPYAGAYFIEQRPDGVDEAPIPYQVTDIVFLDGASPEELKQAVLSWGAVATACNLSLERYNPQTKALWYKTSDPEPYLNHAVTVVGWDDSFPRENFSADDDGSLPSCDGAWLVKNSELAAGAVDPFIWISYDDDALFSTVENQPSYAISGVRPAQERIVHGWDENGAVATASFDSSVTCANVFEFQQDEAVREVMFMSGTPGASYRLTWAPLDDAGAPDPDSPNAIELAAGTVEHAGYTTVQLQKPVKVPAGEGAIVLRLDADGMVSVGVDQSTSDVAGRPLYNADFMGAAGQSYYLGENGAEPALDEHNMAINFSVRAYSTIEENAEPTPNPSPDPDQGQDAEPEPNPGADPNPQPQPDPDPDQGQDQDPEPGTDPEPEPGTNPNPDDPSDEGSKDEGGNESPDDESGIKPLAATGDSTAGAAAAACAIALGAATVCVITQRTPESRR